MALNPGPQEFLLVLFSAAVLLNFVVTVRIASSLKTRRRDDGGPTLTPAGRALAPQQAQLLFSGCKVTLFNTQNSPSVIVFLSSECPKCKATLPQVSSILKPAESAGLTIWIIVIGENQAAWGWASNDPIGDRMLSTDNNVINSLNPTRIVPGYLFVGHTGLVESSGPVGSPDWGAFIEQMNE